MSKYHSYDEFEKAYLGVGIDYDGVAGYQCVDVVDQYWKDVFDITGVWCNGARDFYNNFNSYPALVKNFDKIPNTRDLVVKKGDIVIWGGGTWGHVAIGNGEGNIDWFVSLEQNTLGRREKTQLIKHYFNSSAANDCCNPVLGVLRAKDQSKVLGTPKVEPAKQEKPKPKEETKPAVQEEEAKTNEVKKGDVNGDGKINATDLTKVAAHVKGKKLLNEEQQKAADVNEDGKINVTDITNIAAHIKGKKTIK